MKANKFRAGRSGCEARLYVIEGYLPGTTPTDESGKPAPMDVLRIAANDIFEVVEHLRKWEPHFSIKRIDLIGMIVLLSGTPYNQ
jgi:hypothetical protein